MLFVQPNTLQVSAPYGEMGGGVYFVAYLQTGGEESLEFGACSNILFALQCSTRRHHIERALAKGEIFSALYGRSNICKHAIESRGVVAKRLVLALNLFFAIRIFVCHGFCHSPHEHVFCPSTGMKKLTEKLVPVCKDGESAVRFLLYADVGIVGYDNGALFPLTREIRLLAECLRQDVFREMRMMQHGIFFAFCGRNARGGGKKWTDYEYGQFWATYPGFCCS